MSDESSEDRRGAVRLEDVSDELVLKLLRHIGRPPPPGVPPKEYLRYLLKYGAYALLLGEHVPDDVRRTAAEKIVATEHFFDPSKPDPEQWRSLLVHTLLKAAEEARQPVGWCYVMRDTTRKDGTFFTSLVREPMPEPYIPARYTFDHEERELNRQEEELRLREEKLNRERPALEAELAHLRNELEQLGVRIGVRIPARKAKRLPRGRKYRTAFISPVHWIGARHIELMRDEINALYSAQGLIEASPTFVFGYKDGAPQDTERVKHLERCVEQALNDGKATSQPQIAKIWGCSVDNIKRICRTEKISWRPFVDKVKRRITAV